MFTRALLSVDTWSGLLCAGFGAIFIAMAIEYDFGSAAAMGPAFFPVWLGAALIALGAGLVIKGQLADAEGLSPTVLKPALIVIGGLAVFALLLERAGLLLSGVALAYIGSHATAAFGAVRLVLFSFGLVLFVSFVFIYALGLPIPFWPRFGA